MTAVRSLKVENVRSHDIFSTQLQERTTIITGKNGSGKTTLLEAIAVALMGKSFKGTDSELLRHEADWWRIDISLGDQERVVKYEQSNQKKQKSFELNGKKTARLPNVQRYPVVLFEPDDLRLIHGSPSRRRNYIDKLASQLYPSYTRILNRYDKNLVQRNKLLKNNMDNNQLFAWNVGLAKYGAQIIDTRIKVVRALEAEFNQIYMTIAKTDDSVRIDYLKDEQAYTEQRLLNELEGHTQKDKIIGYTSVGPHRHDILISLNDTLASRDASRGEVRTMVLALKFIEVELLEKVLEKKPIILLDDVFSELDQDRQTHLVTNLKNHQIIMTSVSAPKNLKDTKTIKISK